MNKNNFAKTPPMGWNSYDYYDTSVTEADIRANAKFMADNLKEYGWEYIVVDIEWYAIGAGSQRHKYQYIPFADVAMDEYSRLVPDPERFPSSKDGAGFKPLADYVHSLGLKFGIHIMRGIPRIAAHNHCKIKAGNIIANNINNGAVDKTEDNITDNIANKNFNITSDITANEVADAYSICRWNPDMYGVKNTPEGQAYYDSIIELYASWGVDFIKCDDICNTDNWVPYSDKAYERKHEIEMLYKAIQKCGRSIVLSLSPGPAIIEKAWHYEKYANMWRITDDMWDNWRDVKNMFYRCELWQNHVSEGCFPDCDMLPFGMLGKGFGGERPTNFTKEEQRTVMTLWCIFHSPLMLGAEMTKLDDWTMSLLTNRRILGLMDMNCKARQVCRDDNKVVWVSENQVIGEKYVALFNLSEEEAEVTVSVEELELSGKSDINYKNTGKIYAEELWDGKKSEFDSEKIADLIPAHGCRIYILKDNSE